jgi:hypothetical protein
MHLRKVKTMDGYAWRCLNKNCIKYETTASIRSGSFFENYRLPLVDVLTVIYFWCSRVPIVCAQASLNCEEKATCAIYEYCRLVVGRFLDCNPVQLGGPGVICQIDESAFHHKCKAHRGRPPQSTVWVFGIVDTRFSPAPGYMEIVPDRTKETLLPIIERVCLPGTIIFSDEWAAYWDIRDLPPGFEHEAVNHRVCFVRDDGVHTQHVESSWERHKHMLKFGKGKRREKLPAYLQECMWRDLENGNPDAPDIFVRFVYLIRLVN